MSKRKGVILVRKGKEVALVGRREGVILKGYLVGRRKGVILGDKRKGVMFVT